MTVQAEYALSYLLTPLLIVLFVIGLILAPTPIPFGVPLMALALFLLIATNPHAARIVQSMRGQHRWIHRAMHFVEQRAPSRISEVLRSTHPGEKDSADQ
jgi:hypothetical protein